METKPDIRAQAIARRDRMSVSERDRKSREICCKLETVLAQLPPQRASHKPASSNDQTSATAPLIAAYAAMKSEVDLDAFIVAAYAKCARVCFPCMVRAPANAAHPAALHMEFREVTRSDYERGKAPFVVAPLRSYTPDAAEVCAFPVVAARAINLIVVPLVAFDRRGNRLGYGGGNYDRFLPLLTPPCRITGVAFAEQEVSLLPREGHDVELSEIIRA
ncbi:MAG: 5-formyltetrahydrofolate cyclo-ligase [Raoultibacter sp.]